MLMLALLLAVSPAAVDSFQLRSDLQGVYDEIAQTTLQFQTPVDVDEFHAVFFTPDWEFVDPQGAHHQWAERREEAVKALTAPKPDAIKHVIQKVAATSNGATVTVLVQTTHTSVTEGGKPGRQITEGVIFGDEWVHADGSWRLRRRTQLGSAKTT